MWRLPAMFGLRHHVVGYNCQTTHVGGERKCTAPCRVCSSTTHVRYDCPVRKHGNSRGRGRGRGRGRRSRGGRNGNQNEEIGGAAYEYGHDFGGYSDIGCSAEPIDLLDSGATAHYFTADTKVTAVQNIPPGILNTASTPLKFSKMGNINEKNLKGVKLVQRLTNNLVSMSKLTDDRDTAYLTTTLGVWEMSAVLAEKILQEIECRKVAKRTGGLYKYTDVTAANFALHVNTRPENLLFDLHLRFGHRSINSIVQGLKKGTITGYEKYVTPESLKKWKKELQDCPVCAESKSTKAHSTKSKVTKGDSKDASGCNSLGEVFQADVCYPVKPELPTENGFLTVVEKSTGYIFDAGILGKNETPMKLYELMVNIKPQLPNITKHAVNRRVTADDCSELKSSKAAELIRKAGFALVNGAAYHANSISSCDRAMRTVQEMTRSYMLGAPKANRKLHPYARKLAVAAHNMMPQAKHGWQSPHQRFYGTKPDSTRIHPFYCDVYVKQVNGPERTKSHRYKPVAKLGQYLGIPPGVRGHLILVDGKKVIREDVWFKENLPHDHVLEKISEPEGKRHETNARIKPTKTVRFAPKEGVVEKADKPTTNVDTNNVIRGSRGNRGVPPQRFAPQFAGAIEEMNELRKAPAGPWDLYKYEDRVEWGESTQKEYKSIADKRVLFPVKSTGNEKPMNLLLQYKYKRDKEGKIIQRKVRLCADGRSQKKNGFEGQTFAPVISTAMMLMAMSLRVQAGLQFIQFDWNSAF